MENEKLKPEKRNFLSGMMQGQKDMTVGNPFRQIMTFALPLFIGEVFQQVYNMVDTIVVGRFVSSDALAAVGSCGAPYNLTIALIMGFSTAASVLIAQAFGAGAKEQVRKAFATSLAVIMISGFFLTIIGILCAKPLLILLGTPENILDAACVYLRTICTGLLATCLYNTMSSCLRAVGNSVMPLVALIAASLINVVLDLLFVLAFGMGVFGVAFATVLSQLISGILCFIYASRRTEEFRLTGFFGSIFPAAAKEVLRIGLPAALSSSIVMISAMFMQRAVNIYGSDVTAAYTVGNRTEQIFMCLSFAIGMSVGTFCGHNIGAGKFDRVREGMRNGYIINIIYTVVMGTIMYFGAPYVIGIFTTNSKVIEIGIPLVRITAVFAPVLGFVFIFQNFLRSASDISPTILMSASEITARSTLSFGFSALFGYQGIWWATPVGWTGSMLIGFIRYRSGKWKEKSRKSRERISIGESPERAGE